MNLKLADNWHKWRYTRYTSGISLTQSDNLENDIFIYFLYLGTIVRYQDSFLAKSWFSMIKIYDEIIIFRELTAES